jgi:DNA-binding CsgD family transcriptional regulator
MWISPRAGAKLAKRTGDRDLTLREGNVLRAVSSGKRNKEIGNAPSISEATVEVHMAHILEKLALNGFNGSHQRRREARPCAPGRFTGFEFLKKYSLGRTIRCDRGQRSCYSTVRNLRSSS